MRILQVAFLLALAGHLRAEGVAVLSPDGHYFLQSFGDNDKSVFTIEQRASGGGSITNRYFSSTNLACLKESVEHGARYAVWSPDSQKVAVCVRTGKDIEWTFVLARRGDTFRCDSLPDHDPDKRTTPLRWLSSDKLVVEISGSWGGHHDERWNTDFYTITAIYRYNPVTGRFKKITESKPSHPLK